VAAQTPQCLLPFYTVGFALGDEPTLSPDSAEDATLDDLLAETLQQLILTFIRSQNYACHFSHPLPCIQIIRIKTRTRSILTERTVLVNGDMTKGEGPPAPAPPAPHRRPSSGGQRHFHHKNNCRFS